MSPGSRISLAPFFTGLLARVSIRRKTIWVLLCLLALVPMIHMSWLVRQYSVEVPTLDDWAMAPLIVKAHSGALTFADLYAQQEEARYFLPKLIFVLSAAGGHWDVRDQMMLSVLCSWLTAGGVFLLLLRSSFNRAAIAICFGLMMLSLFSPAQFELWIFASGFPSFLPALFLVAALVVITTDLSTVWKFLICAALAVASSFTLAHGLLAWGLTFPVLFLVRPVPRWRSWLVGWLGVCALCSVAYFWDYQRPPYHPSFAPVVSLREYALFILEFLGGGLAYSLKHQPATAATIFGALQLAFFLAALIYTAQRIRDRKFLARVSPWFALGLSAIGSAVLAALGRVEYGAAYALASRYVTFSLWLTIAVTALVAIIGIEIASRYHSTRARMGLLAVAAVLIAAFLVPYKVCAANTRFFMRALSAKDRLARGAVLFSPVINTSEVIKKTAYPGDAAPVLRNSAALDRLGLLRPPLLRTNLLRALPHERAGGKDAFGSCEKVTQISPDLLRATGWAVLDVQGRPADCVVAAYQTESDPDPIVFAISDSFEMRADVVKRFRSIERLWSGWAATFPKSAVPPGATLSFWAVDADQPKLYQLPDDSAQKRR